jgi:hypothetical protein
LIPRLRNEQGFSIVTAIMLLGFMLSAGLASYAYVDTEQDQSRVERVGESSFNLTEGLLNTQTFILSRNWPRTASRTYPAQCTQASAPTAYCPQPGTIAATFTNVDHQTGAPTWVTTVHDDDDGDEFYDQEVVDDLPAWDANGNDRVWVRAEGAYTVGARPTRKHALVALVRVERVQEGLRFPQRTLIAGKFETTNNGKKIIVQTNSTETSPHPITLRCTPVTSSACANYDAGKGQIAPTGSIVGGEYVGQTALPPESSNALRERAITDGTFYSTCPTATQLAQGLLGGVVWIDGNVGCSYTSNTVFGSTSAPGILILRQGTLSLAGVSTFHGVVYALNELNLTGWVVTLGGNTEIDGRIFIDGPGGLSAGSSKVNLTYNDFLNAQIPFTTYGTAGIVQNSWREIATE